MLPTVRHVVIEVHKPEIGLKGIAACIAHLAAAGFAYDPDGSSGTNIDSGARVPTTSKSGLERRASSPR